MFKFKWGSKIYPDLIFKELKNIYLKSLNIDSVEEIYFEKNF